MFIGQIQIISSNCWYLYERVPFICVLVVLLGSITQVGDLAVDFSIHRTTHNMALRDTLEIYIPREADVRSIPLCSLPNSILRRMGLPLSHSDYSKRGTWICPAVIRRKGQKVASDTGNDVKKEFLSLMGRESRAKSDPQRLSFVSSNRTAYDLLKATNRGSAVSADTSHTSPQCQDLPPGTLQDAVLVYNGQIYLSLRNPNRQSKKKMCDPKMVAQSFPLSTSDLRKVMS